MVLSLWLVVTVTFILMNAVPGGPFTKAKMTPQVQAMLMRKYGLDKPLWEQYVTLLRNLLHLDLGVSLYERGRDVSGIIANCFPASALVGMESLTGAVFAGLALGIVASLNRGKGLDYVAVTIAIVGASVPNFVVAASLQYVVGGKWGLLPIARWGGPKYHILPAVALGFVTVAGMARLMRSSMLEVINQDYIRTAKAKGLSSTQITWRHCIRNAILPVVTVLGPTIAAITTGTLVVERMFAIPGLGRYYVESISNRDYPVIMGTTVFFVAFLLLMTFLVDILYGVIDPRIRLAGQRGD
jgi:oligopeptide transport system permease protein